MTDKTLPEAIQDILDKHSEPDAVFTASPEVLNREFERKEFGHRALIHSHCRVR